MLGKGANRANLHLMPTSGTRYYRWNGTDWACVYAHELSEEDKRRAIDIAVTQTVCSMCCVNCNN